MLRMCVPTVFTDTGSSAAISCRDRFVGRYRSTFSSPALISSPRDGTGRSVAAGDAPLSTSRMSASSAACAVSCRGSAVSSYGNPSSRTAAPTRSASARARARSAA